MNLSRSSIADYFSRAVAFALPLVYFLVTISFYLRTYDSAQIKITLTQAGCGLVILFWVLQLIFERRWPFSKSDLVLVAPFLAMLASGVVSYIHSSFRAGSLDEFTRRVFYSFMALIVIVEFRGMDRQRRLMRWLVAAFALSVFYGFIQYFDGRLFPPTITRVGLDPFIWRQAFGLRVFSTFGNPNFYGNFLVIITPILIALYYRHGGKLFRPFFMIAVLVPTVYLADRLFVGKFGGVTPQNQTIISFGLLATVLWAAGLIWWNTASAAASGMLLFFGATFVNLYASETKGAWVGFVGALVASAFLAGLFLVGKKARRMTIALGVVSLIVAGAGLWAVSHYAKARRQSVDFRVFTWIATWDMIRTQPWLGTGIGSFKWAYPAFRRPEIILLEARSNTETDHAENEYLEIIFDEGVVGFGIFLWLVISVSVLGVRMLNRLTSEGPRPPPALSPLDERVYKSMAYLGAWWGALLHWFMDVSIRFVSSGIFSFFLPAMIVCFVRNDPMPVQQDVPSSRDRWVRVSVLVILGLFFIIPDNTWRPLMGPPLVLFCLGFLYLLAETLEWRLVPASTAAAPSTEVSPHASVGQWVLAVAAIFIWVSCAHLWRGYFIADVSHNVAIFFSKQMVWEKSLDFDGKVASPDFPADMREEYNLVGGALEHYDKTFRLNPAFPMAMFFRGNVYNDWCTGLFDASRQARQKGNVAEADSLFTKALEKWDLSLQAYNKTKAFAPNYVQTHHQVGLLYLKRGEMESDRGDRPKAEENWRTALHHFDLYNKLDPVFPPNYYRQSYVHFMLGDKENAEKDYLNALVYNSSNSVGRIYYDRLAETYSQLGRMCYVQWVNESPKGKVPAIASPLFAKSKGYYQKALQHAAKTDRPMELSIEPAKQLAYLYAHAGLNDRAQSIWLQIRQWAPQDPDVQRVFSPPQTH